MKTWFRHLTAILLLAALSWLFASGREDLHPVHLWNRRIADAAFVLLCLTLFIGPAGRFVPALNVFLPWRRELGIAFAVGAGLHVLIYVRGVEWDWLRFFARAEGGETVLLQNAYAAANWIGLIALLYGLVLAVTSNNLSQRLLGRGWKFLQQQSYTLFMLTVLHAGVLLYLAIETGYGIFRPVFWGLTLLTIFLQVAGYIRAVRGQARQRGAAGGS